MRFVLTFPCRDWLADILRPVYFQRWCVRSNDCEIDFDRGYDDEFTEGVGQVDILLKLVENDEPKHRDEDD